jgi:integrase
MVAAGQSHGDDALLVAVAEKFLELTEGNVSRGYFQAVGKYVADFCSVHGDKQVRDLLPIHVTEWLAAHPAWGNASQRAAIAAVKRMLNWARKQRLIAVHPLADVEKPAGNRREHVITADEHAAMMQTADDGRRPGERIGKLGRRPVRRDACFRQVLIALAHTGARPGMIGAARIEQLAADLSTLTIRDHKTRKKTGRPLVIYLTPCLQTLMRAVAAGRSSGPIFRNSRGEAWTSNAIRCRMRRLREKLGLPSGVVGYAYRHAFATKAIMAGNDVATVAELLGHRDVSMIQRHYGHLDQQKEHLVKAAARAVRR